MTDMQLYTEIATLPENLKKEVSDFVAFLKHKTKGKAKPKQRKFGYAKGFFTMANDFDAPLTEFEDYM